MSALERVGALLRRDGNPYECRSCGRRFEVEYFRCPECGSYSVDRRT